MAKGKNRKSNSSTATSGSSGSGGGGGGGGASGSGGSGGGQPTTTTKNNENKINNNSGIGGSSSSTMPPPTSSSTSTSSSSSSSVPYSYRSLYQWCVQERQGLLWVISCALLGSFLGFGIGSGILTGQYGRPPTAWRSALGMKLRSTRSYQYLAATTLWWASSSSNKRESFSSSSSSSNTYSLLNSNTNNNNNINGGQAVVTSDPQTLRNDPSHPIVFAVLREAVVREQGGYVHPDLGILSPAPSGAARGLGMIRDTYHICQIRCIPGLAKEKLELKNRKDNSTLTYNPEGNIIYKQEEVLIKVPLTFQMTRTVALETLLPRISAEVQRKANLHELDDAALLVLLLAHERGVGRYSRWLPYIASLPLEPSCGYSKNLRPHLLDSVQALKEEVGLDVNGWGAELLKATQYAERIANGLARDYGAFLQHPKGVSAYQNIEWALCQVASRATAGSQKHGALRMVPLMDMINHDANAGGFVELTGKERLENGDFVDAMEDDSGAFVIRSLRHGRRKALRPGQELLVNYNVPHYSPLDWFVSLGFVPPERWSKWQKMDAALPRIRRDGPFGAPDGAGGGGGGRWQTASSSTTTTSSSTGMGSTSNNEF